MLGSIVRPLAATAAAATLLVALASAPVAAGGPPSIGFYVDDVQYRTVGTPTDFFGTGAPDSSFDTIYALGDGLMNVAESKPGDTDYNGGRWMVLPVTWAEGITPVQFTNDDQILAAEEAGLLTIADAPVKEFLCPVIPALPGQG